MMMISARMMPVRAMATKTVKKSAGKATGVGRTLWLPNYEAPAWLDGSLPGDAGFDPLGLGKPAEYLQFDLDNLDQNLAQNKAGKILGSLKIENQTTGDALTPYSDVFDIIRFRECELIHGRWAMLATLGAVFAELNTGVSWVDAGKVEAAGASYFGLSLPFDVTQLTILTVVLMGGVEVFRSASTDTETRLYPGGAFDPLGLASNNEEQTFRLKTAEIKHARLAMVSAFGFAVQAGTTLSSPIENLSAAFP